MPDELSPTALAAWTELRDRLLATLGDELIAMWAHGGMVGASDPAHLGDLDTYVIVARRPDEATARQIEKAQRAIAEARGVEWDAWYVVADDARSSDQPHHAWREGRRDTSWAIHRAHWLAGRRVILHGPEPQAIVRAPSWDEILGELDRELEHIERHVVEGDSDPLEATYAFLNGSRILRALATSDVATSKDAAGAWGLDHLPVRWHEALRAALRCHAGHGVADDAALLANEMRPFVKFVRENLPPSADRRPDAPPRWSGY